MAQEDMEKLVDIMAGAINEKIDREFGKLYILIGVAFL